MDITVGTTAAKLVLAMIEFVTKVRETMDPELQKQIDAALVHDYLWVRDKVGIGS